MRYPVNITDYLEETVARKADSIAVVEGDIQLSFAGLFEKVLHEALRISKAINGAKKRIIAVYLPKGVNTVIIDLAILFSGNAYMNLDVKNPAKRINSILRQTQPLLMVAEKFDHGEEGIPEILMPSNDFIPLKENDRKEALNLREGLIDTDLCCLINTSGSTGVPKAVALNHRGFIDFTEAALHENLVGNDEIVGSLSPAIFDIFSFELCMMMSVGAKLVLLPESLAAFPARMLEIMAREEVNFIFWVPTIMVNIANMDLLSKIPLPKLKMIWFAGEVFPTGKFNYWRRMLPGATFANFYGPIEISLDCLFYVAENEIPDEQPIPIGRPFRNTSILVLDENGALITEGEIGREGELCVRGSSLAMGYYNNPEKTSAAFIQNPLNEAYPEIIYRTGDIVAYRGDGNLVFKGRKDTLIKHSGYRIELGEIEHIALGALAGVSNVCVLYNKNEKKIVLLYEAEKTLPEKDMRHQLGGFLPRYMIPARYVHLAEMPRNANGKIDRNFLKEKYGGQ